MEMLLIFLTFFIIVYSIHKNEIYRENIIFKENIIFDLMYNQYISNIKNKYIHGNGVSFIVRKDNPMVCKFEERIIQKFRNDGYVVKKLSEGDKNYERNCISSYEIYW